MHYFKTLLISTIALITSAVGNLYGQGCNNPVDLPENATIVMSVEQGTSFGRFISSGLKTRIWIHTLGQLRLDSIQVQDANCSKPVVLFSEQFQDSDDEWYAFDVFGLPSQKVFHCVLYSTTYIDVEVVVQGLNKVGPINTCNTLDPCGFIINPGFEEEDPNQLISSGNLASPLRYIDYACGWGIASTPQNYTPDYYLAPLDPLMTYTTCTPPGNGNECQSKTAFGLGVAHIFIRDFRSNINNPDRREMMYQTMQQNLQPGRNYVMEGRFKLNTDRSYRASSVQARFTANYVLNTNQSAPTFTNYSEVDFTPDINLSNNNWQPASGLFKPNQSFNQVVIGNFRSNANTPYSTGVVSKFQDSIPSVFIDGIEVYDLGDAGIGGSFCQPFTIGDPPVCYPSGTLSFEWTEPSVSIAILGSGPTLPVTNLPTGQHTLQRKITYNGDVLVDAVSFETIGDPQVSIVNDVDCSGSDVVFELDFGAGTLDPGYTILTQNLSYSNVLTIKPNGELLISDPKVTSAGGIGHVTITGTQFYNGLNCPFTLNLQVFSCCSMPPQQAINVTNMSASALSLPSLLTNETFIVHGTFTIDQDITLERCTIYMDADASIAVNPNINFELLNYSEIVECGPYRWHEVLLNQSSTMTMDLSSINGAITGVHVLNGASIQFMNDSFEDCLESIQFDSHNQGNVTIENCDFNCGVDGYSNVIKQPGSPFNVGTPNAYETGISIINSTGVLIDGGPSKNRFRIVPNSIFASREISFYSITSNSQDIEIYNNNFGYSYCAFWLDDVSQITIGQIGGENYINPNQNQAINYGHMDGVYAINSEFTFQYNTIEKTLNGVRCFSPKNVTSASGGCLIFGNIIDSKSGILLKRNNPTSGRVRVLNNTISAINVGITIDNLGDCSVGNLNSCFVSNNTISLAPVSGVLQSEVYGIHAINSRCNNIGENTISSTHSKSFPASQSLFNAGVKIDHCTDMKVVGPVVTNFTSGLLMYQDNNSTKFSCLQISNCENGIWFNDVGAITNDVYDFSSFSMNYPSTNSAGIDFSQNSVKLKFTNCFSSSPWPIWRYSNNSEDPLNFNYGYYTKQQSSSSVCYPPIPKNKKESVFDCQVDFNLENDNVIVNVQNPGTIRILSIDGRLLYESQIQDSLLIPAILHYGIMIFEFIDETNHCVEKIYFPDNY